MMAFLINFIQSFSVLVGESTQLCLHFSYKHLTGFSKPLDLEAT